jgi:hypothetical protein
MLEDWSGGIAWTPGDGELDVEGESILEEKD